ncbi:DUF6602 domain-containing protein [Paenarthrobacter sp. RAF9]
MHVYPTGSVRTDGRASRQVDILVLKPSCPARLINKRMYLVTGVSSAFGCKTTSKKVHLAAAVDSAKTLRQQSLMWQRMNL